MVYGILLGRQHADQVCWTGTAVDSDAFCHVDSFGVKFSLDFFISEFRRNAFDHNGQ
jgi:hypothetical protein